MKALKVTPLRNGCCVVTTGTAKTILAAVRAQTDHPLDQPALTEGVFIFDLFGLCCGLCVTLGSQRRYPFNLLLAELSVSHISLSKSECNKIGAHPRWIFELFLPRSIGPSRVPSDSMEGALESYRPRHYVVFLETGPIIRTNSGYGSISLAHRPF